MSFFDRIRSVGTRRLPKAVGPALGRGPGVEVSESVGHANGEPADPSKYGARWAPADQESAMDLILNSRDPDAFDRSGREHAEFIGQFLNASDTVLDFGCGIGRVARYVGPLCHQLWAVDASTRMLELAERRLAELENVVFAACHDTRIPDVPDASVDFAYALLVLQHLEREDAFLVLEELRRVLKPAGRVHFTFPNFLAEAYGASFLADTRRSPDLSPTRARVYTPQEVSRVLELAGFTDIELGSGVEIMVTARRGSEGAPEEDPQQDRPRSWEEKAW